MTKPDKRPAKTYERAALRQDSLPNLYSTTRPPTLAATNTAEVTDQDIGLKHDPVAQVRAEEAIRAALSYRVKQAEKAEAATKARRPQIVIAAEELQISVDLAEDIADELVRIASRTQGQPNRASFCSQPPG